MSDSGIEKQVVGTNNYQNIASPTKSLRQPQEIEQSGSTQPSREQNKGSALSSEIPSSEQPTSLLPSITPSSSQYLSSTSIRQDNIRPENIYWQIAYVAHPSRSINESHCIWFNDIYKVCRPFRLVEGEDFSTVYTISENPKHKDMSVLLETFCQKIKFPSPLSDKNYGVAHVITAVMFSNYNGTTFNTSDDLPYAIKGITIVDYKKRVQHLNKKTNGQPVLLQDYKIARLHRDEGLMERGIVTNSIISSPGGSQFAFVVMVDVASEDFHKSFDPYPSDDFDLALVAACYIFHQAMQYINDPSNHTEAATLARQIGRGVFDESVREVKTEEVVGEKDKAEGGASKASAPKPKKKKKSKKSKKSRALVKDGEASVALEDTTPTITIQPPTPQQETSPVDAASSSAPPPTTTTSLLSAAVQLSANLPREIFSFLSTDPRLVCQLPTCTTMANATNPSAVCCPRCTAWAYTRYCSIAHLQQDVRRHFASACGGATMRVLAAIDDSSPGAFPASALPVRPYVQELASGSTPRNILERHRQALWRSMSVEGDYFVFNDIDLVALPGELLAGLSPRAKVEWLQPIRGMGTVVAVVNLRGSDVRKEMLEEVVTNCLRFGMDAGSRCEEACAWLFGVVREVLRERGEWDARMEERVAVQMGFEFGWRLPGEWMEF